TGGSYSVQPVGSVGLSPAGFSGLMLFPNSVFAADLIADFSTNLSYFSMMYCPLELGCDDSSTIRATAFLRGVQVGTITAQVPVPGTYPTGTVEISVPTGFDRVVVHYDAHPLRCQDWGPEFLADNVTVLRACGGASITQHPIDTMLCAADTATFQVAAAGPGPFTYQWRHNGQTITNGSGGNGGTGLVTGANEPILTITPIGASLAQADAGLYDCIVSAPGACELVSLPAQLTILEPPSIIAQPIDLSTCPGSTADFFFELAGSDPMDVSWSHDGVPIDPVVNPTAAMTLLSISPARASVEGSYTCTASNACGSVMSVSVNLSASAITTAMAASMAPTSRPSSLTGKPEPPMSTTMAASMARMLGTSSFAGRVAAERLLSFSLATQKERRGWRAAAFVLANH
ncbi:MAG: immunoglobulin domain-containing protein, partial [Planctomycetota bacterium]|nr:immunoglobulin domain-containing protein [Planctomycetota bacterium]